MFPVKPVIASIMKTKNAQQSTLVSLAVMHAPARKLNVQALNVSKKYLDK